MFIWGNFIFLALMPFFTVSLGIVKLSQATVNWILKQDMISIFKQWRPDFSGKHLCDGYCMDILWCLCVEVKIENWKRIAKLDWKSTMYSVVKLSSYFLFNIFLVFNTLYWHN